MKPISLLLLGLLLFAGPTRAAQILIDRQPTIGLQGFTTSTLSILTEGEETLRGFDAEFSGNLNQALAAGMDTVFTTFDAFLPFGGRQDTKFLFAASDVLSIGAEESSQHLVGAISGLARLSLPNPTPLVRLVSNDLSSLSGRILFDLGGPQPDVFTFAPCLDCGGPDPDPATVSITSKPAIGVPGARTYTLLLDVAAGAEMLRGIDATFDGPMFQFRIDPEDPTTFQSDLVIPCLACLPAESQADSHFLFDRDDVVGGLILPGEADTAERLEAIFSGLSQLDLANPVPIAQITTADPSQVSFDLSLDLGGNDPFNLSGRLVPEPTAVWMVVSVLAVSATRRRRVL